MVAVPFPLSTKLRPLGNVPAFVIVGVGNPVVVTIRLLFWPTAKIPFGLLVIAGAWFTVRTKF